MNIKTYIAYVSNSLLNAIRIKKQLGDKDLIIGDKNLSLEDILEKKENFIRQLNNINREDLINSFNISFNEVMINYNMEDEKFENIIENYNNLINK
jgi:hypothetical protein